MDRCRLTIAATGGFFHPLGDQTPIDCRYGEFLETVELPHKKILCVTAETIVDYGGLKNPRAVLVWNMTGMGSQVQPTPEEAARIAASELLVGLTNEAGDPPAGWLRILPYRKGEPQGGSQILWLAPGTRVVLRPANPGSTVIARTLVIPGNS